jgi:predicted SnoaL-like aldol condensation-catalyzing enzyme
MTEEENKAVVQRFYEEVFNQEQEEVLDELISPDYIDYGHEPPLQGIKPQESQYHSQRSAFTVLKTEKFRKPLMP